MNALHFGVKSSRFKVGITYAGTVTACTGGGIQYWTSHVELEFLVVATLLLTTGVTVRNLGWLWCVQTGSAALLF